LAVTAALVAWLIRSDALDFGALSAFLDEPALLAMNLAVFALAVALAALRWRILLRAAGVELSAARALQLQDVGMFFNVAVPGNIGGDIVKSIYVARAVPSDARTAVFLVAVVDRAIALAGLVAVGAAAIAARGAASWHPPFRELTIGVATLAALL